jgi:hypothetical protein
VTTQRYEGACHCGVLSYRYDTVLATASWPVRSCQCSFCRLHAALTTSDRAGTLSFSAADLSDLQRYRFGARSADFLICRRCGAYLGATIRTGAASRSGLVNLRTLCPMPGDLGAAVPMNYDGESPAQRMARRESRWTPLAPDSV